MDEVFGSANFISQITFAKTTSASGQRLATVSDYLLWYGKDQERTKTHSLYLQRAGEGWVNYNYIRLPDGTHRRMSAEESANWTTVPVGSKIYRRDNLTSQRPAQGGDVTSYELGGRVYGPGKGTFKTDLAGLNRLAAGWRPTEPRLPIAGSRTTFRSCR